MRRVGALLLLAAIASAPGTARAELGAVGPTNGANGFPLWYSDLTGRRLELCLDYTPYCGLIGTPGLDTTQPISFPDNFPDEAFWWMATADLRTASGSRFRVVLALEAAFSVEVREGDQIAFARVRVRVSDLLPNQLYTVTHPYGVLELESDIDGEINMTSDVGVGAGIFTGALKGDLGDFLVWNPIEDAPAGYIGDPNVAHAITGGLFDFVRIEGPGVGTDPAFPCIPARADCIESHLFSLQGKNATMIGADPIRATLSALPDGSGYTLDLFAKAPSDQLLNMALEERSTSMRLVASELFFGRLLSLQQPTQVALTNRTDTPDTVLHVAATDLVRISKAEYDLESGFLEVVASSSLDLPGGRPHPLQVLETSFTGNVTFALPQGPPERVTVLSQEGGGSATLEVALRGQAFIPPADVPKANAGTDQIAQQGTIVILDGSGSQGTIENYKWAQVGGTGVALQNALSAQASFLAPAVVGTLSFLLTVTGPAGSSTDLVQVALPAAPFEPQPDLLTLTSTEYRTRDSDWRLDGTASPGATVTIYLGSDVSSSIIGAAIADGLGVWRLRAKNSPIIADAASRISLVSSTGARLVDQPITTRN